MHIVLAITVIGFSFLFYKLIYIRFFSNFRFSKSYLSSEQKEIMLDKGVWRESCPVHIDRLNILNISYYDFFGIKHDDGKIIVLDVVADNVIKIFKELYKIKFPIHSLNLMDDYLGDDEKSMQANNSSGFNCRNIIGTNEWSIHAYGLAIDINPEQNPYILNRYEPGKYLLPIYPPVGMNYLNRLVQRPGMVESIIGIFKKNGFAIWGGEWIEPLDYHHFQLKREDAEILAKLDYKDGKEYFNQLTEKR